MSSLPGSRVVRGVASAALAVALIAAIFTVDYIPTNDGPNTLVAAYLDLHLHDPGRGYSRFLEQNTPISSAGFQALVTPLARFLPFFVAVQLAIATIALVWAFGWLWLARSVGAPEGIEYLGFATALSWPLYMGFYSFWLSAGCALVLLALALRMARQDPSPAAEGDPVAGGPAQPAAPWAVREYVVIGAGLLLISWIHVFGALAAGLVLAFVGWFCDRRAVRYRLRTLLGLGLAGAPALAVCVACALAVVREQFPAGNPQFAWMPLADALRMLADTFAGGPAWRAWLPVAVVLAVLLASLRAAMRGELPPAKRALAAASLTFLVACFALPLHVGGWSLLSVRFVPFALVLGAMAAPAAAGRAASRPAGMAAVAAIGFALASLGWSAHYHLELDREVTALIRPALATPIKRSGRRLPIILKRRTEQFRYGDTLWNLGHLAMIEQGGVIPYLFARNPAYHSQLFRRPRQELFPPFPGRAYGEIYFRAGQSPRYPPRAVQWSYLASLAARYDDVILVADEGAIAHFLARGWIADARAPGVLLGRYRGCGLDVRFVATEPLSAPLLVEYGWGQVLQAAEARAAAAHQRLDGAGARLSFDAAPCGAVWVRAFVDRDRSGGWSAGDTSCVGGSDASGRSWQTISRRQREVVCRLP